MNFAQDRFVEYMVKRKRRKKDLLVFAGAGLLGAFILLIGVVLMLFVFRQPAILFFCLVGAIALVWYLCTRCNVEFEYAFTNGFVSVDKIINKSSRKRLTSFECSDVEEYGSYEEMAEKLAVKRVDTRVFASADPDNVGGTYLITRSKKTGYTILVFDPSDSLEEAMRAAFPRQLRAELIAKERERR